MHVAIAVPPLAGHVIPSLGLAHELVASGHRVTYVANEKFREMAQSVGAALAPTTVPYDGLTSGFLEDPVLGPILGVIRAGTAEIASDLERIVQHFTADPPHVVCTNYVSQIGFPLADRLGVPRVTLYPTFAWNTAVQERLYGKIVYTGAGLEAVEERHRLAEQLGFTVPEHLLFGEASDLNLVSIPRLFQYDSSAFDDRYLFMGPSVAAHPGRGDWQPRSAERPLLYISLGTTYNDNIKFFRTCVEQFADGPYEVAMSVGGKIAIKDLGQLPENIEVRRSFPQISVLERAAVFLTHAGTGSAMEAITLQVPMVALAQQGDQVLYARKLHELGLGVDYSLAEDPALLGIAKTVEHVATDPDIRARLAELHEKMAAEAGLAAGVRALESLC